MATHTLKAFILILTINIFLNDVYSQEVNASPVRIYLAIGKSGLTDHLSIAGFHLASEFGIDYTLLKKNNFSVKLGASYLNTGFKLNHMHGLTYIRTFTKLNMPVTFVYKVKKLHIQTGISSLYNLSTYSVNSIGMNKYECNCYEDLNGEKIMLPKWGMSTWLGLSYLIGKIDIGLKARLIILNFKRTRPEKLYDTGLFVGYRF